MQHSMYDIISKKKRGECLSNEEISFFVEGYTDGSIPDYQASALLMAICIRGMEDAEITALTMAMADSGDRLDLSRFANLSVDKHSTGGVGDKTSLIVAPIAASLGCKVAKMSGRGLGHTGGTIDKLESIPGYKTTITDEEFFKTVEDVGLAIIGQSKNLAPADKKIYALRDVTATVDSIPLITASIMSKKLAAGTKNIVLDVKYGSGAFMKTTADAYVLAKKMAEIGSACNRNVAALITDMQVPLGCAIGNACEIREVIKTLHGEGPDDLTEVSLSIASAMISLSLGIDEKEARKKAEESLSGGAAFSKFREWISAQGGDVRYIDNPDLFEKPTKKAALLAECDTYIGAMDAEKIGIAAVMLGAGRHKIGDEIDFSAGITLFVKPGDFVRRGTPIAEFYTSACELSEAEKILREAIKYSSVALKEKNPLIADMIYARAALE